LCALSAVTIARGVAAIVGYGVAFWLFRGDQTSIIVLGLNLAVSLGLFAASAFIERASIFTASLICACTSFLSFSGCSCTNPIGKTDIVVSIGLGGLFVIHDDGSVCDDVQ
jgi:hypothetical protein